MARAKRDDNGQVMIFCPGCDHLHALDERWSFNGDFEKPTFHPSLKDETPRLKNGVEVGPPLRVCHSFITDGRIQFLGDSTHALAGQTVDLPDHFS